MTDRTFARIGATALEVRTSLGLSAAEVAEASRMGRAELEALESTGAPMDATSLDRVGRALGVSGRHLVLGPRRPSALVAGQRDLAAILESSRRGLGMPSEGERDLYEVVEALDDMAALLGVDGDGCSTNPAVPHPARPEAPDGAGLDPAWARRAAELAADAFLHDLVTGGRLREVAVLCLGQGAGEAYAIACRDADEG